MRAWYAKKRYLVPLGLAGIVAVAAATGGGSSSLPPSTQPAAVVQAIQAPTPTPAVSTLPTTTNVAPASSTIEQPASAQITPRPSLSNDNRYVNSSGNTVHSPAYSNTSCAASGASAECGDGTCSFSQHRSGTCSHHGGVAQWIQ